MDRLDQLVWVAHADAWQAEGRLRESNGGGAIELPGARLMASGLPHAQWNNGDVTDSSLLAVEDVRAWYASRAGGSGVPWGLCVQAGSTFTHGQFLFRKRCMGLAASRFRPAAVPPNVEIAEAIRSDVETVARIDALAFGGSVEHTLAWIEPHFEAMDITVALARVAGEPVGIGTSVFSDGHAGRCVGIFGVGVLEPARRRGIGAALTSWLLERAFATGTVLAHLNPDTDAAAGLYARLGFVETSGLDIYGEV